MEALSPPSPSPPATVRYKWRSLAVAPVIGGGAIIFLLLWFARSGLFVYLSGDDLMNMYQSWRLPYGRILLDNLFYFTSAYRPMGALVYRVIFDLAGTDALPFRLLCFGLILANLYLLYRTAAIISTQEAGLLAALFASYNSGFIDLYYNSGTIYDLLCFTFYFLALRLYVKIRQQGRPLKPGALLTILIFYICALNAKETAVTLPVILFFYELTLGRDSQVTYLRWRGWPVVVSALLTVPFVMGKLSSASPLMGNEAYRLHLGLRTYFRALRHYVEIFILPPTGLSMTAFALGIVLLGVVAIAGKRYLLFAWLFFLITPLPVAFIGLRGGYAIYISTFGLALLVAGTIVEFREALIRHFRNRFGILRKGWLQGGTFAVCLLVLFAFHKSRPLGTVSAEDHLIQSVSAQIRTAQLTIDPQWRILFLDDPFPEDFALLFLLRLYYRAPELVVDRIRVMPQKPNQDEINSYDRIFTFDGNRLMRVK
jgi:hypothetical protein